MPSKPLLMLVDGHALIHRAYHALPPLTVSKTGEVVNAVYGFTSMLLKVLNDYKPTHLAITFDRAAPTFRHLQYDAYKAQRPRAPDELVRQFARVRELVEAFHFPVYEVDGFEADDVIGTLCRQASEADVDCLIVTGDTDVLQLVSPHVRVVTAKRNFGETVIYDEQAVRERYGLEASALADFKGLQGDVSDNIPGVPGVGEKTATKLLQQFGSIEGVYAHIDQVNPLKLRGLLKAHEAQAQQSRALATISTEAPVRLSLDDCRLGDYDPSPVRELFRELEFRSLLAKLPEPSETRGRKGAVEAPGPLSQVVGGSHPTTMETDYRLVHTEAALQELAAQLAQCPSFSVDTETTHKEPMRARLVGLSLSYDDGRAWYIPVGHEQPTELDVREAPSQQLSLDTVMRHLCPLLEDPSRQKIAHNAIYDMLVLAEHGAPLRGVYFDTMIAAYLLNEKALGLKDLAFTRLGVQMTPITDLLGSGSKQLSMAQVPISRAADYACADADIARRLVAVLEPQLKERGLWQLFTEVEMPLVEVLARMERTGVALDTQLLRHLSQEMGKQLGRLEGQIYDCVGHRFNINSTQQLGAVLFDELKLPAERRTRTGYSTEASVLENLRHTHPIIDYILEYRQLAKLKSTYVDALPALINPKTGRVHTSFNQTGTSTGRLSSSDPNLQNIPVRTDVGKRVREAFIPGEASQGDVLLSADYSQIDLRVLAHLSQDPRLVSAFLHDEDIHAATASEVFGVALEAVTPDMRRVAKTVNFGVIYGMSDYGLSQGTELSREEAAQFIAAYFEKYAGVKQYLAATKEHAREKGYVQTLLGRRRYIPEVNSSNVQLRLAAERMAINMPVQGTSADIIKVAMINIQREVDERGLKSKMILQVHDELVFEVPPHEVSLMKELAPRIMSQAVKLTVPLKVDVKTGKNWGDMA